MIQSGGVASALRGSMVKSRRMCVPVGVGVKVHASMKREARRLSGGEKPASSMTRRSGGDHSMMVSVCDEPSEFSTRMMAPVMDSVRCTKAALRIAGMGP